MIEAHFSRHWNGPGELEYLCPCPKAPCGMVVQGRECEDCMQHPPERTKTIRSSHTPEECPGYPMDVITGFPDHYIVNGDTSSCPCPEHDTFFASFTEDDWAVAPGTAFIQAAHGGWVPVGSTMNTMEVPDEDPFPDFRQRFAVGLGIDQDTIDPQFAEDIRRLDEVCNSLNNREYDPPMSSDAMWVSYSDGREERPL